MDRLDAMQVLLTVVDAGSLSAGSRKLNAPLPSVSRKVADLERHLGTRLLIRTSRNVQLTDAGRDYVEAARQIVAQIKDAELRASGEYEVPRGELTLTVTMAFGREIALPLAYQFLSDYPEITLRVLSVDRAVQLVDERIDVGVRLGELADSSLVAIKVGAFCWLTCASPDYLARKGRPSTPDDLADHDAVVFDRGGPIWTYQRDGIKVEARPKVRVYTNTTTAAVRAAVQSVGIVRAPSYQVRNKLRAGELVPVLTDYENKSMPVHLVYVRQGLLPLKVRVFIDWMVPQLKRALIELADYGPADDRPA